MCRGFQQNDRDRLKIKSFHVNVSVSRTEIPDSLTLYFLPRINGSALEVNGSSIRPDSPSFITLHRVVSPGKTTRGVIYGTREKVKGSEGLRFEIYMCDVKVLKGIFRKSEGQRWKLECSSELEGDDVGVKQAEICVAVEDIGGGVISEKVDMKLKRRGRGGQCVKFLEEIPEEREGEGEGENEFESEGCCCCECLVEVEMDGEDEEIEGEEEGEMEAEMEGVRWAVDVGIWVVCLGVGYLVTKASSRRLRRRKRFI